MSPRARVMRRAFTLLEALVAVGMLVLLLGALAYFVDDLGRSRQHVARMAAQTRSADALFGAVESALQTAVVDGGSRGAGVTGTDRSLRVLSSRTDAGSGSVAELARAAFSPLSATQVDEVPGSVAVGRGGAASVLPARIGALRFQYWDGAAWTESFDSLASGALPGAVEVAVWFGEPVEALGPPDRVRIIPVPDAAGGAGDSAPQEDRR